MNEFNGGLDRLKNKFQKMKDVEYDRTKVDYVYEMTKHSLEGNSQIDMLLDRLKMIEQMHQQSPNLKL
jgi:hypothetical protein